MGRTDFTALGWEADEEKQMIRPAGQVAGAFLRRRKKAGKVQLHKYVNEWVERRYRQTGEWPIVEDVFKFPLGPVIARDGQILDLRQGAVFSPMSVDEELLVDEVMRDLDAIGAGEALSRWSHHAKAYWIKGEMFQPVSHQLMLHNDDFVRLRELVTDTVLGRFQMQRRS